MLISVVLKSVQIVYNTSIVVVLRTECALHIGLLNMLKFDMFTGQQDQTLKLTHNLCDLGFHTECLPLLK